MTPDPLARFSAATAQWFSDVFTAPTPAQEQAWSSIAEGNHTLVVAPTGSGKTLAAFLWALDHVMANPAERPGTRVVYVSPLKALGVDVERNLRAPLVGIRHTADRLGSSVADVRVGVRSGDTPTRERAALVRHPPDVLITTPESLYLLLTSSAQSTLTDVTTVIVDEIHALAGTKRGSHLALSLERLDQLTGADVQRIALSATVRPIDRVAAFLGGDRQVKVVNPPARKHWDVRVRLSVDDITSPPPAEPAADPLLEQESPTSIWPHVERDVYESVMGGRSTLVFTNSRRTAERLTARLNEMWAEVHDPDSLAPLPRRPPADLMGSSPDVTAAPMVIARAHHGSVSKQAREEIEAALKSGELRCVVATSSLELGIDMGAVDRVIQISAPPSVASALQRIGRAGHHVGAVSHGDVHPLYRGDLVPTAVTTERMLAGRIEELKVPRMPLDVLTQQTIAASVAAGAAGLPVEEWMSAVTRSMPFAGMDRSVLDAIIDLTTGAYPSADFSDLRARLVLEDGRLRARPGTLRLAVTSGGTIPDRGMFRVYLATQDDQPRRVGELDEEMVYESRVGDVFTLGASSWRIQEITRDQVLVTPAPGHTGRLPFWRSEQESRPAELGMAIGRFVREAAADDARLELDFLDERTRANIAALLTEQRDATAALPDDRTVVLERFRDEVGDWRFVLHCSLGHATLGAWALAIGDAISHASGIEVNPVASDDGIIWRMPDSDLADRMGELVVVEPEEAPDVVTRCASGSALFAARFRECAARALLLPRRDPGRRAPLWQQRQRASQLLEVAQHHPRFPIIIETLREVLQDVYDLPALVETLQRLQRGSLRLVEVTTTTPSPLAAGMLFRYTGAFLYESDTPLAERRAATLSMDPELLASVLGSLDLREVLDPEILESVEADLQHLSPERQARDTEALIDLPSILGPLTRDELACRHAGEASQLEELWADPEGASGRRLAVVGIAGTPRLVARSDLGLLRDALGIPLPSGAVEAPTEGRDPLTQLVARYARTHATFTADRLAEAFGLGSTTAHLVLQRESAERRLIAGHFTPGQTATEYCDPEVLRRIRQRSLAAARAQVQPVSGTALGRFLGAWHQTDARAESNPDEVLMVLQRLAALPLPASAWESHVLPARLTGYRPSHLDELVAEGEVVIRMRGSVGASDPLVALVPIDDLDLLTPAHPTDADIAFARELTDAGGTLAGLAATRDTAQAVVADDLWAAAEAGALAPSSMAPIRERLRGGAHKQRRPPPRSRPRLPRPGRALLGRPSSAIGSTGRWYLADDPTPAPGQETVNRVSALLERHGVLTRGVTDDLPGGFAAAYKVLSVLEQSGKVLRSHVVEGLGGAQFATSGIIDEIRQHADAVDTTTWPSGMTDPSPVVLAVVDPANPYGQVLPWPEHPSAHPSRAAGALVVLVDGVLLAHLTRGGKQLTLFEPAWPLAPSREVRLGIVTSALLAALTERGISRLRIEEIDGERVSPQDAEIMRRRGARLAPNGMVLDARG